MYYKKIFFVLGLFVFLSNIFASANYFCGGNNDLLLTTEKDIYTNSKFFTIELYVVNCSNLEKDYTIQIVQDEDFLDNFKSDIVSKNFKLEPNESKKIKFNIEAKEGIDSGTYSIDFIAIINKKEKKTFNNMPIRVHINEFSDDLDLYFDKSYICIDDNEKSINFIIENNGNKDLYFKPKIESDIANITYNSDEILVKNNEKVVLELKLGNVTEGMHYFSIENNIKGSLYKKELSLNVKDCEADALSMSLPESKIVKRGSSLEINYTVYNNSNKDIEVYFSYNAEPDYTVAMEKTSAIVNANSSVSNKITIYTNSNTDLSTNSIEIIAYSNKQTISKTYSFIVEKDKYELSYVTKTIPVSNIEDIEATLSNNSGSTKTFTLSIEKNNNNDNITLSDESVTIANNESKKIKISIAPVSTGAKSFNLIINDGSNTYSYTINYIATSQIYSVYFLEKYRSDITTIKGTNEYIDFTLSNPLQHEVNIKVHLDNSITGINSNLKSFNLKANQSIEGHIKLIINKASGSYSTDLIVESDLGIEKYPVTINVIDNTAIEDLVLDKNTFEYIPNSVNNIPLKIKNPNKIDINASISIDDSEINFTIDKESEKTITIPLYIESSEAIEKELSIKFNDKEIKEKIYLLPKKNSLSSFFALSNTTIPAIILGIIIILAIALVFVKNKKPKKIDGETQP